MPATALVARLEVEPHPPAGEVRGVDAAEDGVGVGHRRLAAAAAVAGRAGRGAGTLRPDANIAAVEPGERAAAGADDMDVDDRHLDRQPLELGLVGERRPPVDDEARVEGGAAHVDADQVRPLQGLRHRLGADIAADRTGEEGLDRMLARRRRGHGAAVRLHDVQVAAGKRVAELAHQRREVAFHHRRDIGLHDGGRGAGELAPLLRDAVREGHRGLRQRRGEMLCDGELMHRVAIGVQEADGDRVVAARLHRRDQRVEISQFDRRLDRAVGLEPLGHHEDVAALDQALRLAIVDGEDVAPVVALDGVDVAEIARGDQRDAGALPLEHRVQPDGGAVDEEVDRGMLGEEGAQALEHGAGRIGRRRQELAGEGVAGRGVLEDEIGERAADIGGDAETSFAGVWHQPARVAPPPPCGGGPGRGVQRGVLRCRRDATLEAVAVNPSQAALGPPSSGQAPLSPPQGGEGVRCPRGAYLEALPLGEHHSHRRHFPAALAATAATMIRPVVRSL